MSFIPKNPLSIPEIENTPSTPPGTRGLFAKKDGWYEVNDKGVSKKFSSKEELDERINYINLGILDEYDNDYLPKYTTVWNALYEYNKTNPLSAEGGIYTIKWEFADNLAIPGIRKGLLIDSQFNGDPTLYLYVDGISYYGDGRYDYWTRGSRAEIIDLGEFEVETNFFPIERFKNALNQYSQYTRNSGVYQIKWTQTMYTLNDELMKETNTALLIIFNDATFWQTGMAVFYRDEIWIKNTFGSGEWEQYSLGMLIGDIERITDLDTRLFNIESKIINLGTIKEFDIDYIPTLSRIHELRDGVGLEDGVYTIKWKPDDSDSVGIPDDPTEGIITFTSYSGEPAIYLYVNGTNYYQYGPYDIWIRGDIGNTIYLGEFDLTTLGLEEIPFESLEYGLKYYSLHTRNSGVYHLKWVLKDVDWVSKEMHTALLLISNDGVFANNTTMTIIYRNQIWVKMYPDTEWVSTGHLDMLISNISNLSIDISTLSKDTSIRFEEESNYMKDYVAQELATFDFIKVVDSLPEEGLANRIYLVPKSDAKNQDLFDEYVWANGKWEWITTKQVEIDLADYVPKSAFTYNAETETLTIDI